MQVAFSIYNSKWPSFKKMAAERNIISACLVGLRTRYDGGSCPVDIQISHEWLLPVCPEQLGGLPTPREPVEIIGGDGNDVLDGRAVVLGLETKRNFTAQLIQGAQETLAICKMFACRRAIFKSRSPSCGCGEIYYDGKLIKGDGVTTALLKRKGIEIIQCL